MGQICFMLFQCSTQHSILNGIWYTGDRKQNQQRRGHDASKYRQLLVYVVVALLYYLIPVFLIQDTGSAMFLLLIGIPVIVFVVSMLFSVKFGYYWYFPIVIGLLWIPNLFLLNDSAAIYILMYAVVSLIGQLIGLLFKKQLKNNPGRCWSGFCVSNLE